MSCHRWGCLAFGDLSNSSIGGRVGAVALVKVARVVD